MTPTMKADRPLEEWNRLVIAMKGDQLPVELNGERVIENGHLPNVPTRGPITLQRDGEPIQFANLYIRELN